MSSKGCTYCFCPNRSPLHKCKVLGACLINLNITACHPLLTTVVHTVTGTTWTFVYKEVAIWTSAAAKRQPNGPEFNRSNFMVFWWSFWYFIRHLVWICPLPDVIHLLLEGPAHLLGTCTSCTSIRTFCRSISFKWYFWNGRHTYHTYKWHDSAVFPGDKWPSPQPRSSPPPPPQGVRHSWFQASDTLQLLSGIFKWRGVPPGGSKMCH